MKKYKLRKWVKVVITLILIIIGIVIYHYLGVLGSYISKTRLGDIFILVGWFWLIVGQIMMFYAIWEN